MRLAAMAVAILSVCLSGISQTAPKAHAAPAAVDRIDVNHATAVELLKVPGMTHTWAERIVRYRPYRTKQDLLDQGVVTGEVYDRIKDYVIAHRDRE